MDEFWLGTGTEARDFTSEELFAIENELFDENALKKEFGVE